MAVGECRHLRTVGNHQHLHLAREPPQALAHRRRSGAADTGVDLTLVVHFDEARSREPADDFVREVLVRGLGARAVVVGDDFHFGHKRQGNVELLRRLGSDLDFDVLPIGLLDAEALALDVPGLEESVSSTAIRAALPQDSAGNGGSSSDPESVAEPLARLKQLLESDDGEAADFIIDARPALSGVLTATEIEALSGHVGDFNFEAALKCLSGIASRLSLNLK